MFVCTTFQNLKKKTDLIYFFSQCFGKRISKILTKIIKKKKKTKVLEKAHNLLQKWLEEPLGSLFYEASKGERNGIPSCQPQLSVYLRKETDKI